MPTLYRVVLGKFDDWPMEWWCKCKTSTLVNTAALKFIKTAVAFGVIIGANILLNMTFLHFIFTDLDFYYLLE
jgi:hypothetical protein